MSDIYVVQRANGDVFALDDHGRFSVPLFNSSSDVFLARLRTLGMLVIGNVRKLLAQSATGTKWSQARHE